MNEFPIIKISLREEIDNKKMKSVPRGNDLPSWVLAGDKLDSRIKKLNDDIKEIKSQMNKRNNDAPNIIKAMISEKAIAKSYRKNINATLTTNKDDILGMYKNNSLLYRIDDENIGEIENKIATNFGEYAVSAIESIKMFEPEINMEEDTQKYKIKLLDFNKYENVERNFISKCESKHIEIKKVQYTDQIKVYSASKDACLDILNDKELLQFVYGIESMPQYDATMDSVVTNANIVPLVKEDKTYVNVGVLDTGIEELDINKDWLMKEKRVCYTDENIDKEHGTMVSTVLLYGDQLIETQPINASPVNIFDATVFGFHQDETIAEDGLIINIKEVISKYHNQIKIWNLSLGSKNTIKDDEFSDFAKVLDELQNKYNILICKSAGNYKGEGDNRICNGADSVMSLVVGSLANKKSITDLADINTPSPFSRVGRAPASIIKPDVVHYGGNCGTNFKNGNGIVTINHNGDKVSVSGTSFSTPRITSLVASIQDKLGSTEIDPLLLKALVIHSSSIPKEISQFQTEDVIKMVGYGIPKDANSVLKEYDNKTTLVLRDKIRKKRYIEVLNFPYPDELIEGDFFHGKITVTLVLKPYLDQEEGSEYCQSDVNIEFGTYSQEGEMTNVLENDGIKRENSQNILTNSIYSKKAKMNEKYLIQYKNKYYPVKKFIVDLDKITSANKNKFLRRDRKWYLKLSQLYREKIEREYEGHLEELEQDFCLIISFEDNINKKNIHDGVIQKLIKNNFVYQDIVVRNDISIHE